MDTHPWTYRVSSEEARREGRVREGAVPGFATSRPAALRLPGGLRGGEGRGAHVRGGHAGRRRPARLARVERQPADVPDPALARPLPQRLLPRRGRLAGGDPRHRRCRLEVPRLHAGARGEKLPPAPPPRGFTRVNRLFALGADYSPMRSLLAWSGDLPIEVDGAPAEVPMDGVGDDQLTPAQTSPRSSLRIKPLFEGATIAQSGHLDPVLTARVRARGSGPRLPSPAPRPSGTPLPGSRPARRAGCAGDRGRWSSPAALPATRPRWPRRRSTAPRHPPGREGRATGSTDSARGPGCRSRPNSRPARSPNARASTPSRGQNAVRAPEPLRPVARTAGRAHENRAPHLQALRESAGPPPPRRASGRSPREACHRARRPAAGRPRNG